MAIPNKVRREGLIALMPPNKGIRAINRFESTWYFWRKRRFCEIDVRTVGRLIYCTFLVLFQRVQIRPLRVSHQIPRPLEIALHPLVICLSSLYCWFPVHVHIPDPLPLVFECSARLKLSLRPGAVSRHIFVFCGREADYRRDTGPI